MSLFFNNTDTTSKSICDSCENIQLPMKAFFSLSPQLFSSGQGLFSSSTKLPNQKFGALSYKTLPLNFLE